MNTQSVWVALCRDAIQELRAAVKQAKFYRAACCQAFAAALAAQLALEHFVHCGSLSTSLAQQQQRLCASMTAAIELAQRRIQACGSRPVILKHAVHQTAGHRWKQSALQKLQAVTTQLDTLVQQVWDLQIEADAIDPQDRYHPELRRCLECALSPHAAREAATALASLTLALVSGLQEPSLLSPKLAGLGPGQLQVTTDQALEVLGAFRTLLGASPAELTPQASPALAIPGRVFNVGRQNMFPQFSPATLSHLPGQFSSFDSAQSHAHHAADLSIGHVVQAVVPPPSHAEHAVDPQKRRPQLGQATPGPSWQSQAVEAHRRHSSTSEQHCQGVAGRTHSQTSKRASVSPFDAVRNYSHAQEGSPHPSDVSELSHEAVTRLHSHTSNHATVSPFDAVRREFSVQEAPCLMAAGLHQTGNASAQSQTDTSQPHSHSACQSDVIRPSAATHPLFASSAPSATPQDSLRQGVVGHDIPEAQRVSQWALAQMSQSCKRAESSPDFKGSSEAGLAALSGQNQHRPSDQQAGQFEEMCGANAFRRTSMESYQPTASVQQSRRSSLELLENLNCPVIGYDQLQIKRKIGDGSIGLVYLGKWQETDVGVKVLLDMQQLAPSSQVQPQDPATLKPWSNRPQSSGPPPTGSYPKEPEQEEDEQVTVQGLKGVTDLEGSIGVQSQAEETPQAVAAMKTLEREVSIMASLRHPNVVMFMGLCLQPPCIVTEFCARGSLFDVLRKACTSQGFAQQLDWGKRLNMALDAAKGVLHLHSHKPPILHRDLKSPNMLVERHWRVKVTDFNLSRMVQTSSPGSSIASLLANNPRWLAPEVVEDHQYSKAADVYSFGIIMWEMMTWDTPWEDLNAFQIMLRLSKQERPDIPPLEELPGQPLPGIRDYICLMKECWSQDPSKRPSFQHVIIQIRGLLEGAASKQKLQKTLTEVPRLGTSCMVPASLNKLPVAGQNARRAAGPDPQKTPTPLDASRGKGTPLQVYETHRPFFGSAPVGGLDILCCHGKGNNELENIQYHPLSGQASQQALHKGQLEKHNNAITRRHTYNGTGTLGTTFLRPPHISPHSHRHKSDGWGANSIQMPTHCSHAMFLMHGSCS